VAEISLHRPFPASEVPSWDLETDVAVIGFGAAGACAAIEAADAGARVMLFERNSGSGGASGLSGGEIYIGGGGGTDAQRAAGFEDSTEDFTAYLKLAGGPCADEAKCELYGREALNHYAWLKAQGVPYRGNYLPGKHIEPTDDSTLIWSGSEAAAPFCDQAKPAPRGHVIQHMGWGGGRPLVDVLEASARAKGVEVVVDARALALICDGPRVVGLVVRIDNQPRFVKAAKGVALATGGFVFNEAMRRKYCPETFKLNDPIGDKDDGSGHRIGPECGRRCGPHGAVLHDLSMDHAGKPCLWRFRQRPWVSALSTKTATTGGSAAVRSISRTARSICCWTMAQFIQPMDFARMSIAGTGETAGMRLRPSWKCRPARSARPWRFTTSMLVTGPRPAIRQADADPGATGSRAVRGAGA
jgi:3-oxo-5alpha-steroid 4-dehydrogenase